MVKLGIAQPELTDMGQVMRDVARQVNDGALDSEGVKWGVLKRRAQEQ